MLGDLVMMTTRQMLMRMEVLAAGQLAIVSVTVEDELPGPKLGKRQAFQQRRVALVEKLSLFCQSWSVTLIHNPTRPIEGIATVQARALAPWS